MLRITTLITLLFAVSLQLSAQDKKAMKYAKTINKADLYNYLSVLTADSLEGRETGQPGQKKAAKYIAQKFESFGLEPAPMQDGTSSYMQSYPLNKLTYRTAYLKKGDEQLENGKDFLYYSRAETMGEEYIDVAFAGAADIDKIDFEKLKGKYVGVFTDKMEGWRNVLAELEKVDAAGIFLFIEDSSRHSFIMNRYSRSMTRPRLTLESNQTGSKIIFGNPALAEWVFGMSYADLKSKGIGNVSRLILNADMLTEVITAENVIGYIKGSEKPDEYLIVTGHYDHLGMAENGDVYHGADDDGSGTSMVIEMAQAFGLATQKGNRPKRSIIFMTVSGEEKGLLGSEYYTENPVFPLENTVANLNIDMIGRVDEAHKDNPEYIYLIGSDKLSQDLHLLSEQANKTYTNIELDYTYNDENDPNRYYYRSDHYNFVKKGVPIIFYFNGTHPDYHRTTDTIEKIAFEKMTKIGHLVFYTAWEIANRDERIKLDEVED